MAGLSRKYRLLKGLCGGGHAYAGPFFVTVDLTRRCNLRCLGCRFHSEEIGKPFPGDTGIVDFPVEWAEKLFTDITRLGTRTLLLVADGEPLMCPHFFEIIHLAKRHGLHTTVTTNGTLMDDARVQQLIDSGLDAIHVSLWSSSPESYAQHYPGADPANFHRVTTGLEALSFMKAEKGAQAPHVTLLNPIDRFNYRDVGKMAALAKETGCDAISFTPFRTHHGELDRHALSAQEQVDLRHQMVSLKKRVKAWGMEHYIDRFLARSAFHEVRHKLPCYVCWFHSRVKVDGTVLYCGRSTLALGNLKTERFADIWNGEAYRTERLRRLAAEGCDCGDETADCQVCSFVTDNQKIHRIFKHLLPFRQHFQRRN